ncbi:hypothetical protein ACVWWN_000186 [Mycobacterium sp. URHB0021]
MGAPGNGRDATPQDSMNWWQLLLWGLLGGLILQFVALAEYRFHRVEELPSWLKGPVYWPFAAGFVLLGGFSATGWIPHGVITDFMVPIQVGMAAPAILNIGSRTVERRTGVGPAD